MLGILGGMGPLATIEFMRKVAMRTSKSGESGCLPMLAVVDGRIPDRSSAILHPDKFPSPLYDMRRCLQLIEHDQVAAIVIPCNTAHFWIDELRSTTIKPIISIIDAVAAKAGSVFANYSTPWRCCVLGTQGLLKSGVYQDKFQRMHHNKCEFIQSFMQDSVEDIINFVKKGKIYSARKEAQKILAAIVGTNPTVWILACTELSIAFEDFELPEGHYFIDSTEALVDAALESVAKL